MKHFLDENYYELLELSQRATPDQIQRAYEHAKKTFSEDSLAAYSLFTREDRQQLLERIEQAFRVLMDESSRRQYDEEIALSRNLGNSDKVMSSKFADPSNFLTALPEPLTGKELKNIRERLGISLQDIASRTRIHLPYLQFIEEDRFEKLPHEVYLRAYLAQYAQVMGLDASRVVQGYLKSHPKKQEQG